jgi:CBS domain-containing protein
MKVSDILKTNGSAVITVRRDETVLDLSEKLRQERFRHLPVQDGQKLVGIISIGDVMKHRLSEVQLEADVLRDYARVQR